MFDHRSPLMATRRRTAIAALSGAAVLCATLVAAGTASTATAASCASTPNDITMVVNPASGASLFTASPDEAQAARAYGFTDNRGTVFSAR